MTTKIRVWTVVLLFVGVWTATAAWAAPAPAGLCAHPQKIHGFTTCADIAAAEREGAVVYYSADVEPAAAAIMDTFHALFPKIKTNYVRLQSGALYAKILSERQAHAYVADVMALTDVGLTLDFQKRNGYQLYVSPEMSAYKPEYKSKPEGLWTWRSLMFGGIAYNPDVIPPSEAPKSWLDLLNPKYTGKISVKTSNSGLQHVLWYMLAKLYGPDFWQKFAQLKPHAFDSYVQQYDLLVNRQDLVAACAQDAGYLQFRKRGAPVKYVYPTEGVAATPDLLGIVANAPHPNAARLFMDWFLSAVGQKPAMEALCYHSARPDVPPGCGGDPLSGIKLLVPDDWNDFLSTRTAFNRQWDKLGGLR